MRDIAVRLLSERRKGWIRSRPIFKPYAPVSQGELAAIEQRISCALPDDLKSWLALVGYGDIDQALSFRNEWFQAVEEGEFRGGCRFAQDDLGNFYAFGLGGEQVVFFSRSEPAYAILTPSFRAFLIELMRRDYRILEWVESMELSHYAWSAT